MDKTELFELLESQFGIFLRDEYTFSAFRKSLEVLSDLPLTDKNSKKDIFSIFLHSLLVDINDHLKGIERRVNILESDDKLKK